MKKSDYITILRGLAILLVLIVHVSQFGSGMQFVHPYITSLMNNGARGVQLFYMLSAFTLFLSFSRRGFKENNAILKYFIRRFFRIAPLYYVAIIFYLWLYGTGPRYWLGDATHVTTTNIISTFTFTNSFNPYWITSIVPGGWSVAIEVVFYCLLPFLFYRIKNIQQACGFTLIALFLRLILFILFSHFRLISSERLWGDYLFIYLPNQLPIFSLGIVLYFLIYDKENIKLSFKFLVIASLLILIGLSIEPGLFLPELFYYGMAFFILVYGIHKYHTTILFNPILLYIGKVSYTIYLTHWASLYFLNKYKMTNVIATNNEFTAIINFFLNYLMVLVTSLLLSTLLYYTIENTMQKVGKRIIEKIFI